MTQLYSDSIFWIEVGKIKPNPYQPRKEFNQEALGALAESIRQYGVLQPLVVTRQEQSKPDGGIAVDYELIAGERRLRAAKLAGVAQVPVVIRTGEDNSLMKLELAIIENLQREDLNPVDRAKAFQRFVDEFDYKHIEIAKKIGKSREYVSNSLRLLTLPEEILTALTEGKITEGHARPLMMLNDRPEEQMTLFKEALFKKLTVRDVVGIARRIAKDKVRKKDRQFDPEILKIEKDLTEQLGTRVHIEQREVGGKITIDFFSDDDLKNLLSFMQEVQNPNEKNAPNFADAVNIVLNEEKQPEEDEKEEPLRDEEIEKSIDTEEPKEEGSIQEESSVETDASYKEIPGQSDEKQAEEIDSSEDGLEGVKGQPNTTLGQNFTTKKEEDLLEDETELSKQEAQILELANQINGKTSEESEKNTNDFDANLMGETEANSGVNSKDSAQKEESHINVPVSEKKVDIPPAPQTSEEDQSEAVERPTLKDFLEEQYKKKFLFLEKNKTPQPSEENLSETSEFSETPNSDISLEKKEVSENNDILQSSVESSEVSNSNTILDQQREKVEVEVSESDDVKQEKDIKTENNNTPKLSEETLPQKSSESSEVSSSDTALEKQKDINEVLENNNLGQEEVVQIKNNNIPQAPKTLSESSPLFETSNPDVSLEQQEERVEVQEDNEVLKQQEEVQNPTLTPEATQKNDDEELYSIKNFSI